MAIDDPRPPGRRSRIDRYFDDHTPWAWADLWSGVGFGIIIGIALCSLAVSHVPGG